MSVKYRLRRLEQAVIGRRGLLPEREIYYWEPTDTNSTEFVREQMFEVHERERKYQIRIAGQPPQKVFDALAKEILPGKDSLKFLSDKELQCCIEKYQQACYKATDESRRKQGFPPLPVWEGEDSTGLVVTS
jgi:hypothetical protein